MPISLQKDALGILATWETLQEAGKIAEVAKQQGWHFLQPPPPPPNQAPDPKADRQHAHLVRSGIAVSNMLNIEDAAVALRNAGLEVS